VQEQSVGDQHMAGVAKSISQAPRWPFYKCREEFRQLLMAVLKMLYKSVCSCVCGRSAMSDAKLWLSSNHLV